MHGAMKLLVYQLRLSAQLEMADSGQQPTAGSEGDTLVNDIFDMMSDMKIKKIDIGSERLYFNKNYYMTWSACANLCRGCRRQCKMMTMQPRLKSLTVLPQQRPLATHMVKLKVNSRVESTVGPVQLPVFVLCERRQWQNVRLSSLLD
jgi:hypothetical protein